MSSSGVTDITFQLLEKITNGFSEEQKVGSGGYGEVYKGVLNGEEIAVKKLFIVNGIDDKEFKNEFYNLMKVRHQNIVRLVGYCYEIKHKSVEQNGEFVLAKVIERALCFEYMQEGCLARHISDESCIHDWPTTYMIIKGTCEGLHYLHKGRKEYIYHLDLKPENILLDKNLVPKITDFGLSRLFGLSKTHVTRTFKGTAGYMPPEYIDHRIMTPKNDVFSLGVIIFQMMAGRQGYIKYCESSPPGEFIERVQEFWKRKLQPTARYTSREIDVLMLGVKKCIQIAATCVEKNRDERPRIEQIIDDLNEVEARIAAEMLNNVRPIRPPPPTGHGQQRERWGSKYIAVDPSTELRFPSLGAQRSTSCCMQLINKVEDACVAFHIKADRTKYSAQPSIGIMRPCTRSHIIVTFQSQLEGGAVPCHGVDVLIVRATRVSEDTDIDQKITADFFDKKVSEEGTAAVDEVTLPIDFVATSIFPRTTLRSILPRDQIVRP